MTDQGTPPARNIHDFALRVIELSEGELPWKANCEAIRKARIVSKAMLIAWDALQSNARPALGGKQQQWRAQAAVEEIRSLLRLP